MKSIIEEASSVAKAIEKGWAEAGKPQEFSIKVFEEATKNFIGMTTKSAKVAIFYDERTPIVGEKPKATPIQSQKNLRKAPLREPVKPATRPTAQRQGYEAAQPQRTAAPAIRKPDVRQEPRSAEGQARPQQAARAELRPTAPQEPRVRETWNDEMVGLAKTWVTETTALIGKGSVPFTVEASNYYLKIEFDGPLFDNEDKDRAVFRSFAYLIMQSLRNKFKKSFRGFKVVLSSRQ